VVDLLGRMESLARRILARRRRQGFLELDMPDVDLEFDDQGRVVDAHPEDTSFSHRIIEMFMVEANEAVARRLERLGLSAIRRIHPEPDEAAADELKAYAKSIGYSLDNPTDRFELQRLVNGVRGRPEAYGIHLAVLRSLKKAVYSLRREGHFALASDAYCHFTSPIRRYPDLMVHRQFESAAHGGGRRRGGRGKSAGAPAPKHAALEELAEHCSRTERRAEAAERELTKVKLLEYLEGRVGQQFTGIITGVQAFGLFVEIPELLIDGLVHKARLTDDVYRFDAQRWALVGRRTQRVLRVGSTLDVRIARVDIPRRQLDLEPVEPERKRRPKEKAQGDDPPRGKKRKKRRK